MRVVDLSFTAKPHFRWKVATELRTSHAKGDLFQSSVLTVHCHAFTHVDAPLHFLPGGRHIAELPVDRWIGDAAVVDLTHVLENGEAAAADLERKAQDVRETSYCSERTGRGASASRQSGSGGMHPTPGKAPATG